MQIVNKINVLKKGKNFYCGFRAENSALWTPHLSRSVCSCSFLPCGCCLALCDIVERVLWRARLGGIVVVRGTGFSCHTMCGIIGVAGDDLNGGREPGAEDGFGRNGEQGGLEMGGMRMLQGRSM